MHPDNEHIIFGLGSTIIVRDIVSRSQTFLRGHDNDITCMDISPNGKFIASGQKTHSGFNADIFIWDFKERRNIYKLTIHKVMIRSLTFSPEGNYLASVGGLDDKNTLIIWDLNQSNSTCLTFLDGKAVYGTSLGIKLVNMIKYFNGSENHLVAVTDENVQILTVEQKDRKIQRLVCNLGNIKRSYTCLAIDKADEYVYAGTTTGKFGSLKPR